ncbi:MAG: alpha/beta hydrolase [Pseudomonadota bacterium]|nr:alpha/beta hydrolase [Pseudomonadota bacterium]
MGSTPGDPELLIFDLPEAGRLVCYQWGKADAACTALCVHGLTRNGRDFDFLASALAAGCRVLCPDMPGRGRSDWLKDPAGYNYPAYVATVDFLLRAMNITSLDWIGTSMGGIIGMMMAGVRPGLIQKLVINDIGCLVSAAGIRRIMSNPPAPPCPSLAEAETTLRERCAPFGIHEEAHWQHLFRYGLQERNGCVYPAFDPAILGGYAKDRTKEAEVKDLDLWSLWEPVTKIPVLLIRGSESDILTRATALEMQARHPRLTLREFEHAGHAPALMDASQITMIRDWLKAA